MKLFEPAALGSCTLKNRLIRSATFEGMADGNGFINEAYTRMYQDLAAGGVGGIITGFAYVSEDGRAIHPGQAGIDSENKIARFKEVTDIVHSCGSKIFLQLAHTGRQTMQSVTGQTVWGVSKQKSQYFGGSPQVLSTKQCYDLVAKFSQAAYLAQQAGFDGVQLHAAHGYLMHQFILPSVNKRSDEFGIDPGYGIGTKFLGRVVEDIRQKCGADFAVLVKVSSSDDYLRKFTSANFCALISFLDGLNVDGIEISYGTMDNALNIFRGDIPLKTIFKHNPVFKTENMLKNIPKSALLYAKMRLKLKPFTPHYNLEYAKGAKTLTKVPVISVGGFRTAQEMNLAVERGWTDFVASCRPLLCEPDLPRKLAQDHNYVSKCVNCNVCAVMCDSKLPTRCYRRGGN